MSCKACQGLAKNGSLDGIRTQIKDGVNKSAPLVKSVAFSMSCGCRKLIRSFIGCED